MLNEYKITHDLITNALAYLTKRHPLLQSIIYRTRDESTCEPKLGLARYFVQMPNRNIFTYDNVELIDTDDPLKWSNLVESEVKTHFDYANGPLWRLKIVSVKNAVSALAKSYADYVFVFTAHHSLTDGRNLYTIMMQLLNIIVAMWEKRTCGEMSDEIEESPSSMEEIAQNRDFKSIKEPFYWDDSTHRISKSLGNKESGVHGKFSYLFIESSKIDRLIKAMKQHAPKSKLTSVLAIVFCSALQKVYTERDIGDVPLENYQFDMLTSIRDQLQVKNSQMGVFSLAYSVRVDLDKEETLWKLAENLSVTLHRRIKNNEFVESMSDMYKLFELINENHNFGDNQTSNFAISNLGVMPNNARSDVIRVEEHYMSMPCLENRFASPLFNLLTTVDGSLCWGISFNEKIYAVEFVNDLKKGIAHFIDTLIG